MSVRDPRALDDELMPETHRTRPWPTPASSPNALYAGERSLYSAQVDGPPQLAVALSGGGNRAAAFSIGVLGGLHHSAALDDVDIISAVSGGSYALSWFLLQNFYRHGIEPADVPATRRDADLFDPHGQYQQYLEQHATTGGVSDMVMNGALGVLFDAVFFNALRLPAFLLGWRAANLLNESALRSQYREGLQTTYQMTPFERPATKDGEFGDGVVQASQHLMLSVSRPPVTFPAMATFAQQAGLPAFVFNTTVRPPQPITSQPIGDRLMEFTAAGFGSNSCGYLTWEQTNEYGWEPGDPERAGDGFWKKLLRSREASPFATLRNLNMAPVVSGAALSGTNLTNSAARRFLGLFNFGLEYAVPNLKSPHRLARVSDGGHCENLGAYALLRRQCQTILIVDSEYDPKLRFPSLRRLIAAAKSELGLDIAVPDIDTATGADRSAVMVGSVSRDGTTCGRIVYVKLALDSTAQPGSAPSDVSEYFGRHPDYPQESTANQHFSAARFRAYRALGEHYGRIAATRL